MPYAAEPLSSVSGGTSALAADGPQIVASGLNSPRQLSFSPGGSLYVAEAGTTGTDHCQPNPLGGTACIGLTGSVAKVGDHGKVTRVVTGLPSAGTAAEPLGPSDLTFTGRDTFALTIGLGGSLDYRAGFGRQGRLLGTIVSVDLHAKKWYWRDSKKHENTTPRVRLVADLAAFEGRANPDGMDIDSNPTGIAKDGRSYVVTDSGGNSLVSTRRAGSTVAIFDPVLTTEPGPAGPPGFPADAVPTDVVKGPDGAWYVSQLVGFPFEPGSSTIWRVRPGNAPPAWATGLTNVTSLAFGRHGQLYAVQIASDGLLSGPVGSLVKVRPHSSTHETIAGGLFAPYGVAVKGDNAYVTTGSVSAGGGEVVRIRL